MSALWLQSPTAMLLTAPQMSTQLLRNLEAPTGRGLSLSQRHLAQPLLPWILAPSATSKLATCYMMAVAHSVAVSQCLQPAPGTQASQLTPRASISIPLHPFIPSCFRCFNSQTPHHPQGRDFIKNGTPVSLVYRMATAADVRDMSAPKRTRELWKAAGGGGGRGGGRGGVSTLLHRAGRGLRLSLRARRTWVGGIQGAV